MRIGRGALSRRDIWTLALDFNPVLETDPRGSVSSTGSGDRDKAGTEPRHYAFRVSSRL
jgi:hypothetical protein